MLTMKSIPLREVFLVLSLETLTLSFNNGRYCLTRRVLPSFVESHVRLPWPDVDVQPPTKRWRERLDLGRIWTLGLWNIGHSIHEEVASTIHGCTGTHEETTWASCPWQDSNPWPMEYRPPHMVESPTS